MLVSKVWAEQAQEPRICEMGSIRHNEEMCADTGPVQIQDGKRFFHMMELDYNLKTTAADKTMTLRVPDWMKDKLAAIAKSKGTTMTCVALALIKHGILERVRGDL